MICTYKALYRKWRPLTFDDVVSQPHITTTLINQLKNDKTAHAYLFTGSRGTGKTTCARIFAKTINCPNAKDGVPCLECDICKSADNQTLSDIIEIDAASNNGVDDIRELRDGTVYTPERCKYKIYIIDEVHMLSVNAFNALLKVMEEPPPYVKFILATTEVHKVPATIISRCQRFDFRRIKTEDIAARLLYISSHENITLDENAADLIARIADGGMRDALSLLDQCVAYSDTVTLETVSNAAGIAGRDYIYKLLQCVIDKNAPEALSIIDKLYSMSKDMQRLCSELLTNARNLMILKTAPDMKSLLACLPDECDILSQMSSKMTLDEILSIMNILSDCNERMVRCISKRTELEMCIIRLCTLNKTVAYSQDNSALQDRISQLEDKLSSISNLNTANKLKVSQKPQATKTEENIQPVEDEANKVPSQPLNITKDMVEPLDCWAEILEKFTEVNPAVSGTLIGSQAYVYENMLLIIVQNEFFLKLFKNKENSQSLGNAIKDITGKNYIIKAKCNAPMANSSQSPINKLIRKAEDSDIQVEIK